MKAKDIIGRKCRFCKSVFTVKKRKNKFYCDKKCKWNYWGHIRRTEKEYKIKQQYYFKEWRASNPLKYQSLIKKWIIKHPNYQSNYWHTVAKFK